MYASQYLTSGSPCASQAIAGGRIGDCEIVFDYPHKSGHVAGDVTADSESSAIPRWRASLGT